MWKKNIITIPNILSMFRIVLAFLYLIIFMTQGMGAKREILLIGCGGFMFLAFILYGHRYHELRKTVKR
jgi:phosphatidylglycerophosphate synthase